uniref:Uncharacterized protein n=1 Tax=Arundo donax TaxID=35708 RepID=A0A0A9AA63_ARUDO
MKLNLQYKIRFLYLILPQELSQP